MDTPITRAEHEEFSRRIEDWERRQDKRLELLEESVRQNGALTTSVEKLALSVQTMSKTLAAQGDRLEALEARDGAKWRGAVKRPSPPPPSASWWATWPQGWA